MLRRFRLAIPLAFVLFLADCSTKEWASAALEPAHVAHPVVGDFIRLTLTYNDGAAMSLPLGSNPRLPLVLFSVLAVAAMVYYAFRGEMTSRVRQLGFGLLIGGSVGNLVGRAFSERGVVDFIDVGIGSHRFWIFNVADIGITFGAIILAIVLFRAPSTKSLEAHSQ